MATADSTVTYRDAPGFPGYRVGDDGSVWSCWEWRTNQIGAYRVIGTTWKQMIRKPGYGGYRTFELIVGRGRMVKLRAHSLVLLTFVGPAPEGCEGCHEDGNPLNNALSNLRWDTHGNNVRDCARHGTAPAGEKSGRSKLKEKDVRQIRAECAEGVLSNAQIAKKYGVGRRNIAHIRLRQSWKNLV